MTVVPPVATGIPRVMAGKSYERNCWILSLSSVVAIVARCRWPRMNASAKFFACSYSTLPGSGGSTGLTSTSTSAGPGCPSASRIASLTSPGLLTLALNAPGGDCPCAAAAPS